MRTLAIDLELAYRSRYITELGVVEVTRDRSTIVGYVYARDGLRAEHWHAVLDGIMFEPFQWVGHNAKHDKDHVRKAMARHGLVMPAVMKTVCSLKLARKRWPGQPNHLGACARRIGMHRVWWKNAHNALADAMMHGELYRHLARSVLV